MSCNSCSNNTCPDQFNCPNGVQPDFIIRRHDTRPALEVVISDCNGPIDLTDTVLEVSMWVNVKIKQAISETEVAFSLADNIGFDQILQGDIIVVDRVRSPEQMLVTGFDETNKYIRVQRGYNGSRVGSYPKGQKIKIFRFINSIGSTQMVYQDILQVDGTTETDVLTESKLVYEWQSNDTCVPGCFWLEFKLLKMIASSPAPMSSLYLTSIIPSFVSYSNDEFGCSLGVGVEWVRRFPIDKEGFLIKIIDSPTSENLS